MSHQQNFRNWKDVPFPSIPQIIVQESYYVARPRPSPLQDYDFGGAQANRNAYSGSAYETPDYNRTLSSQFHYQFPQKEYYKPMVTPIDRAYEVSRRTNCMAGSPRLPGLLPCPYGTDAIACAYHAA